MYEIQDTHGAPQCGCEIKRFDEWWEVEEYLDANPDVVERINEMYATLVEKRDARYGYIIHPVNIDEEGKRL